MSKRKHNPERKSWKGFSYKVSGRVKTRVRALRDKVKAKDPESP
jgi:hypothetical protein